MDTSVHLPPSTTGHTALLVVVDVMTGFALLRACKNTEAETIAGKLWKIFSIFGLPKIIQSDNGSEFVNGVIRALVKITGIDHRLISPWNPRADGLVERKIGSCKQVILKLLHGTDKNWPLFVSATQLSINNKIATLTGSSPFALMFGRSLNQFTDYTNTPATTISLDDWKEQQEKIISVIFPAINVRIKGGKDAMTKRLDAHRKLLLPGSIPTGAHVMLVDQMKNDKFEATYVGPYVVARRARNGGYVLRDLTGDILDRHVPADQLKVLSRRRQSRKQTDERQTYEVEQVLAHRGTPGSYEFHVKWKNYATAHNTWEPESSFLDTACIRKYWKSVRSNDGTTNTTTSAAAGK
jgi:hypothetical protein